MIAEIFFFDFYNWRREMFPYGVVPEYPLRRIPIPPPIERWCWHRYDLEHIITAIKFYRCTLGR